MGKGKWSKVNEHREDRARMGISEEDRKEQR